MRLGVAAEYEIVDRPKNKGAVKPKHRIVSRWALLFAEMFEDWFECRTLFLNMHTPLELVAMMQALGGLVRLTRRERKLYLDLLRETCEYEFQIKDAIKGSTSHSSVKTYASG